MRNLLSLFILAAGLCLLLAGCRENSLRPGEIARVNGRSITFAQLETAHHGAFARLSSDYELPSVESLRGQYNMVLFQLICQELVCEYMEQKGIAVTPEEVAAEEAVIMADYPPGAFEETLIKDGIDLGEWRKLLYKHLMVERFHSRVLRSGITISPEEIERYYQEHAQDLFLPEQWHFIQVYGTDKAEVEKASALFRQTRNATRILNNSVSVRDIRMNKDRLPEDILRLLAPLAPWQAAPARKLEADFHSFVMIEKTPPALRGASETFFLVEQALVEDRVHQAYVKWLEKRLGKAKIKVADPLTPFGWGEDSSGKAHAPGSSQD